MTANYIQPPANTGTGLKIDTSELSVGANVVERQNICIADPTSDVAIGKVTRFNISGPYGPIVYATPVTGTQATYTGAGGPFNIGTAATSDVISIYGSASTLVRVLQIGMSFTTSTAAVYQDIYLLKKSTANSGGTFSVAVTTALDSTSIAGTAVVKNYTVAPTSGTTVGTILAVKYFSPITGTPAPVTQLVFDFTQGPAQAVALRGVAEGLVVSFGGTAPANASSCDYWVKWTEE